MLKVRLDKLRLDLRSLLQCLRNVNVGVAEKNAPENFLMLNGQGGACRCVDIKCKSGSFSIFRGTVVRCSPPLLLNGSRVATINRGPSGNGLRRSICHNPIKLEIDGLDLSNETPSGTTLSQAVAVGVSTGSVRASFYSRSDHGLRLMFRA